MIRNLALAVLLLSLLAIAVLLWLAEAQPTWLYIWVTAPLLVFFLTARIGNTSRDWVRFSCITGSALAVLGLLPYWYALLFAPAENALELVLIIVPFYQLVIWILLAAFYFIFTRYFQE